MIIEDLDLLRPEPRAIKLAGKEIDVSFIPVAITFDVDRILRELNKLGVIDPEQDDGAMRKAFDLSVELCVLFCEHNHPEMDSDWFYENVDAVQVKAFTSAIREALVRAYEKVTGGPKNAEAPRRGRPKKK